MPVAVAVGIALGGGQLGLWMADKYADYAVAQSEFRMSSENNETRLRDQIERLERRLDKSEAATKKERQLLEVRLRQVETSVAASNMTP